MPLQGAFPPLPVAAAVPIPPPDWFPVTVPSASISPARSISEPQKRSKAANSASTALHPPTLPVPTSPSPLRGGSAACGASGAKAPPGALAAAWQCRGPAAIWGHLRCWECRVRWRAVLYVLYVVYVLFRLAREAAVCGGSGPEKKTGGDVARPRPVQLSAVSREAAIRIQPEHRVSARRMPQPDSLQAGWHRTDDRPILRGERLPRRRPHPEPLWRTGSAFRQHPHPA